MKYVAFDLGNVIVHINFDPFIKVYREFSLDQIDDPMVFLQDLQGQHDLGLTTIARAVKERFGISQSQSNDLVDAWNSIIEPNEKMVNLLEDVKSRYRVALLSNIGLEHAAYFRHHLPHIFEGCDLHLSCEVGARKPSKLYYQSFLMEYPEYKSYNNLYIDDLEANLLVGKKYFKTYHFELDKIDWEKSYNPMYDILKDILINRINI